MRYLVTGGTGFIGSNLAAELLGRGEEVFVTGQELDRTPAGACYMGSDFANLDLAALGPLDAAFHQAANNDTTFTDRSAMIKTNVTGSRDLFEALVKCGCKKIVYASSTAVYGNLPAPYRENGPVDPLNVYAESKVLLDQYAMAFAAEHPEIRVVGLRYCNVYGPGEMYKGRRASMIWQLTQQMLSGNPRIFEFGEQQRDYLYVKDAIRANILALESETSIILNCGFGCAVNFNDLIGILNEVLETSRTPEYIPNPFGSSYQAYTECDMSLAKHIIGFTPQFDLRSGIRDYFGILKSAGKIFK